MSPLAAGQRAAAQTFGEGVLARIRRFIEGVSARVPGRIADAAARIRRLGSTLRPWRFTQYYGRMRSITKNRARRFFPWPARMLLVLRYPHDLIPAELRVKPGWLDKLDRPAEYTAAENVIKGIFRFHGVDQDYGNNIRWRSLVGNYMWDMELHSFRFLDSLSCLAQDGDHPDRAIHCSKDLMRDWIERCAYPHRPAWHPDVISMRIPNWIKFLISFPEPSDIDLWDSISQQAACLQKNIEIFLPGTELIENGIALAMAGLYFSDAEIPPRWLDRGMRIINRQLQEQVLPGGGHVERSPMYHCIILESLINCHNLLKARQMEPVWMDDKLKSMTQRIADLIHPDHDIPLMNDSSLAYASNPLDIIHYAKCSLDFKLQPFSREHEDDGYHVFKDGRSFIVIDGGPIGPDYLPSHGHADTLSYEMSIDRKRVIVDSGVFSYDADDLRAYCRGTPAHNTVMVDSCDQSEMWRSFRVGHRAKPVDTAVFDHGQLAGFTGAHDGYRFLSGNVGHDRVLLHVLDRFFVVSDLIDGEGKHRLESYLHFRPHLAVDWHEDRCIVSEDGRTILQVIPFGHQTSQAGYSWYCPEFGCRHENLMRVFAVTAELPHRFGYFLIPSDDDVTVACGFEDDDSYYRVDFDGRKTFVIRGAGNHFTLE